MNIITGKKQRKKERRVKKIQKSKKNISKAHNLFYFLWRFEFLNDLLLSKFASVVHHYFTLGSGNMKNNPTSTLLWPMLKPRTWSSQQAEMGSSS